MIYTSTHLKQSRNVSWNTFKKRLQYQLQHDKLLKIKKGIYTDQDPRSFTDDDFLTIWGRIYSPSYLSFETVLAQAWFLFQYESKLTYAWPYTREFEIQGQAYMYRRIPVALLPLPLGVMPTEQWARATPERALCDMISLNPNFPVEIPAGSLDRELLRELIREYRQVRNKPGVIDRLTSFLD